MTHVELWSSSATGRLLQRMSRMKEENSEEGERKREKKEEERNANDCVH